MIYCARVSCISAAALSCWRTLEARRSKAGLAAVDTGIASLSRAIVSGSWWTPLILNSKWRCGPVAQPVEPTAPMFWPWRVHGAVIVAVLEDHHIAKAVLNPGKVDDAITNASN